MSRYKMISLKPEHVEFLLKLLNEQIKAADNLEEATIYIELIKKLKGRQKD